MDSWIEINKDLKHVAREKEKARELKKTQWWKNFIASGICHYCHKKFSSKELTMDHVIPISRGGKSIKSNIVPSCSSCNKDKKHLTPVDIILDSLKK